MKLKTINIFFISILVLLLSGCDAVSKKSEITKISDVVVMPHFSCYSEEGFLCNNNEILSYLDYKTGKSVVLCNKPNCSHQPYSSGNPDPYCDAAIPFDTLYHVLLYGRTLYAMTTDFFTTTIYQKEIMTDHWEKLLDIPYGYCDGLKVIASNQKLYYTASLMEAIEGRASLRSRPMLMEVDLEKGTCQILTDISGDTPIINDISGQYLYYNVYGENFGESVSYRINLSDGTVEQLFILSDQKYYLGACGNNFYYMENHILYSSDNENPATRLYESDYEYLSGVVAEEGAYIIESDSMNNSTGYKYLDFITGDIIEISSLVEHETIFDVTDQYLIIWRDNSILALDQQDLLEGKRTVTASYEMQ